MDELTWLKKDLEHLEKNLRDWSSLYNEEDLARVNRMLGYMRKLLKSTLKPS